MEWLVLELTPRSEGEDPETLARAIQGVLKCPEATIFVPAAVTQIGEDRVIHYLVEGYAFVRNPGKRLKHLENSRYVQSVLSGFVKEADIEQMRAQIQREVDQGIGVGDVVKIISGPYRNLTATVIEDIPEKKTVQVFVRLRSKQSIVTLPRSFLQVVSRTPLSGLFCRLSVVRSWVSKARPVLLWPGADVGKLREATHLFDRLESWAARDINPLLHFLQNTLELPEAANRLDPRTNVRPAILQTQLRKADILTQWVKKAHASWNAHWFDQCLKAKNEDLERIKTKLIELYWIEDALNRVGEAEASLERISHRLAKRLKEGGTMVTQNVLVDGHNLAFRCLYAPGISSLTDKQGRPTGVILGFLRSLAALRKRFPEARLYVTWDGSSNRRKALYTEYKGNRSIHGEQGFDQVGFLRELLPKLGVWQRFNPDEEADDVIATLVRGEMQNQHNVIYSTDKDMLSLVTATTLVLMPGVGSRKEILYDSAGVETMFGVPPTRLLQLRALYGDPSDNIPGVPRVPKKVLRSLVQAHQSVDGIYKSSLTGVTTGQYERLRLSEPQVTLNLQLMSFVSVPLVSVDPDSDVDEVAKQLQGVGVNPTSILKPFEGG